MGDEPKPEPAPAPKKRSFFKKAAWQTAVKGEDDKQKDIFSHSSEYKNILAQQAKQRKEEEERKRQLEEEQKRKEEERAARKRREKEEAHERKKRKVSDELGDTPGAITPGSSGSSSKRLDRKRNRSPTSPLKQERSKLPLNTRSTRQQSNIILLSEGSDDSDDDLDIPSTYKTSRRTEPILPELDDELEEGYDPELAAMEAKARAKRREREATSASKLSASATPAVATPTQDAAKDPIVHLFIASDIPHTRPLIVKCRTSKTIGEPLKAWLSMQNLDPHTKDKIFLTWRTKRVWSSTQVGRLGIKIDAMGFLVVEGDTEIYTDDNPPKIHLQAWTPDLYKAWEAEQKRIAAEAEAAKARETNKYLTPAVEPPAPEPEPAKVKVVLKTKGKEDFKLVVKPTTTFEHLSNAYRTKMKLPHGTHVSLYFDGDRLLPMDTVADSEIEDMDTIEVHL